MDPPFVNCKRDKKIRIGTQVNCNSFRYPSLVAKMGASLDVISGGRLEFMIGAGWYEAEYKGYGILFPPLKTRIEEMKEAVQIIKLLWTEHKAYFEGQYCRLEGALNYPKPLQKPYPKIWVGGARERLVRTAAEVADGINLMGTPEEFETKLRVLREACEASSRDHRSIGKSWTGDLVMGRDEDEVSRRLKKLSSKLTEMQIARSAEKKSWSFRELEGPSLVGTPSQIISKMERYMKLGVDYFIVVPSDFRDKSDVQLFREKIMSIF